MLSFFSSPANEPQPGDTCTAGEIHRAQSVGGPESPGDGHIIVCDGANWKPVIQWKTATGNVALSSAVSLPGDLSPAQITANQNDYNPANLATASILRLNTDASRNLTGLAGGSDGRVITITHVGSNDIVLQNQNISSVAANRFAFGTDITIAADQSISLIYDSTSQRWRAASAGGGGCPSYPIADASADYSGSGWPFGRGVWSDGTNVFHTAYDGSDSELYVKTFNGTTFSTVTSAIVTGAHLEKIFKSGTSLYAYDGATGIYRWTWNGSTLSLSPATPVDPGGATGATLGIWYGPNFGTGTSYLYAINWGTDTIYAYKAPPWQPSGLPSLFLAGVNLIVFGATVLTSMLARRAAAPRIWSCLRLTAQPSPRGEHGQIRMAGMI